MLLDRIFNKKMSLIKFACPLTQRKDKDDCELIVMSLPLTI